MELFLPLGILWCCASASGSASRNPVDTSCAAVHVLLHMQDLCSFLREELGTNSSPKGIVSPVPNQLSEQACPLPSLWWLGHDGGKIIFIQIK